MICLHRTLTGIQEIIKRNWKRLDAWKISLSITFLTDALTPWMTLTRRQVMPKIFMIFMNFKLTLLKHDSATGSHECKISSCVSQPGKYTHGPVRELQISPRIWYLEHLTKWLQTFSITREAVQGQKNTINKKISYRWKCILKLSSWKSSSCR